MQSLPIVFPAYFRLVSLVRLPSSSGINVVNEATLYHDEFQLTARWISSHVDPQLKRGSCVSLRGARLNQFRDNCLPVSRIELIEKPSGIMNPFLTIPPSWFSERNTVHRAIRLWEQLGRPLQHLFNAVMWDGGRFYRYITGPIGCSGHITGPGRNFAHAVTVAEQAASLSRGFPDISAPVLIAAALLHDAGKADDYRFSAEGYVLSDRGQWVGYQHTILEWLAVARTRVIMSDALYLGLVHALIARRNFEFRKEPSIEATLLATADRLSGSRAFDVLAG